MSPADFVRRHSRKLLKMSPADFVRRHGLKSPKKPIQHSDECRSLSYKDGVQKLGYSPASNPIGQPPDGMSADDGRHLWIIDEQGIPYILEAAEVFPPLYVGRVKHTNLTGGSLAACGGELWFEKPRARLLYINGSSGRYGPETSQELEDAVRVFRSFGYKVKSAGWDDDADMPARVVR